MIVSDTYNKFVESTSGKRGNTLETDISSPSISFKQTPKMIRGFKNLSNDKIFSRLLQSAHPDSKILEISLLFVE